MELGRAANPRPTKVRFAEHIAEHPMMQASAQPRRHFVASRVDHRFGMTPGRTVKFNRGEAVINASSHSEECRERFMKPFVKERHQAFHRHASEAQTQGVQMKMLGCSCQQW